MSIKPDMSCMARFTPEFHLDIDISAKIMASQNGGCSSTVEPWTVDPFVAGSNPVSHP